MDGFCLQGELDLTLFYNIEGYYDNPKSLMTLMTVTFMTGNKLTAHLEVCLINQKYRLAFLLLYFLKGLYIVTLSIKFKVKIIKL